jgi:uncharacterized protein with PIN domain
MEKIVRKVLLEKPKDQEKQVEKQVNPPSLAKESQPLQDSRPSSTETHKHWTAEEILKSDCPECQKEIEKLSKPQIEKFIKERAAYPFVCDDCGTRVKEAEPECPTCHGKHAHPR